MKPLFQFSVVYLVVGLLSANLAWSNTAEFSSIAERFFIAVRSGDKAAAERAISPQWQESMEPAVFERFLAVLQLNDYQSAKWQSSEITDGNGQLKGAFTSSDNTFPVTLKFINLEGSWLIHGISVSPSTPPVKLAAPDYDAAVALVSATMDAFANAVNERNMRLFYDTGSESFRIRHGVNDLDAAFKQFYSAGDFKERVAGVPGLAKPSIKDGYLIVEGGFDTGGYKTRFKLDYTVEGTAWKLIGFGLSSNPTAG